MKWKGLFFAVLFLMSASKVFADPEAPLEPPSLLSSIREIQGQGLDFCGEQVPLELQEVRERLEKELLLSVWDRPQVILWLKRSRRYFPVIEKMLREAGLPEDLKYIPVAESALRPHVESSKAAVGFWQFVKHTGRKYGLTINSRIDERRNIFDSTKAAIRYLKDLHQIFGSWTLTAAAYNMGENGLIREIALQHSTNYYHLYLPLETQRYVFRILSAKLIFSEPRKYGFKLTQEDYYPPLAFDRVSIRCTRRIPLRVIAEAANTYFKKVKDLNPELRGGYLSPGSYEILIPEGTSKGFHARYRRLLKEARNRPYRTYVVERGDTLVSIAEDLGVPLDLLMIWNGLDRERPIYPGDRLLIYDTEVFTHGDEG